ncbi:hypothetical protein EDD96_4348 [Streptomyces sp. Ag109_G2-6]|uniref:hypothetical protein n=1 Tax=Streptomyces TaxID=1883 RepID=UPI0009A554DF|nr:MULTISPECIES: hypothetical protein [Streptomyces]RPF40580.1 hypothetical protein EDD96_4348 [Streptomyces sp. Ag109_G2-6]
MNEITPPAPFPYQPVSPAQRKRKRFIGAAGTVLALAAAAFAGRWAVNAALAGPEDAGRYRLVPPASFQGLALQESGPRVDAIKQGQGTPKEGTVPVAVVYADQTGTAQLVVSGASGTFTDDDPGHVLVRGLHDMGVDGAAPQDSGTPAGGAMQCGTLTTGAGPLTMCMWADHSSLVTVTVPVENKPVAFDALAAQTRALRAAMEVPAGS